MACAHSDDVIWSLISKAPGFCSFQAKHITHLFCRNEYNVTGFCNRQSCPLANSRYAVVKEKEGKVYLYLKTAERQHLPSQLWEIIQLDKNLEKAMAQIDDHLEYFPPYIRNKNKQRLLRITQYLIRMRKIKLKPEVKRQRINRTLERKERTKEAKAEKIAMIDNKIKAELLERLKQGVYGDLYANFRPEVWNEVLDEQELSVEEEDEFVGDDYEDDEENQARYDEFGGFSSDEDMPDTPDVEDFDELVGKGMSAADFRESTRRPGRDNKAEVPDDDQEEPVPATKPVKSILRKPATKSTPQEPPKGQKRKRGDGKGKRHVEIEYDTGDREREYA